MSISIQTRLILFVAAGVLSLSCRGSGEGTPGLFREYKFTVDSTRLGSPTQLGTISFHVPKDWQTADSGLVERVRQIVRSDTGSFAAEPKAVFVNPRSGGVLIGTTFSVSLKAGEIFSDWARAFVKNYRAIHDGQALEEEWLLLGDVRAVQLRSVDSLRVQFKFLLDGNPPAGIDYSIPRAQWEADGRAVESSLGTIHRLKF